MFYKTSANLQLFSRIRIMIGQILAFFNDCEPQNTTQTESGGTLPPSNTTYKALPQSNSSVVTNQW